MKRRKELALAQKTYRECRLKSPQVGKPKDVEIYHDFYDSHKVRINSFMTCPTVEDMGIPSPRSMGEARDVGRATDKSLENLEKICGATMCAACVYKGAIDLAEVEFIRARRDDSLQAVADQAENPQAFDLNTQSLDSPGQPKLGE